MRQYQERYDVPAAIQPALTGLRSYFTLTNPYFRAQTLFQREALQAQV